MATSIIPPDLVIAESDSGERDQMPRAVFEQHYAGLGYHLVGAVETDTDGLYAPIPRRQSLVDLLGLRDRQPTRCADCTQTECLCAEVFGCGDPIAWADRVRAIDQLHAAGQPITEPAITAALPTGCPPLPDTDGPDQADAWRLVAAHYGLPTDGDHATLVRAVRRMAGVA